MPPDRSRNGKFASALEAAVAKAAVALTLQIDHNLRRAPSAGGTPVDTNHARANWVPSIGAPYTGESDGTSDGQHAAGVAAVVSYRPSDGPLFVSNNVPYIAYLNMGSSTQAPAGFVERCIDEAEATIQARFGLSLEVGIEPTGGGPSMSGDE